jgi:spore germination cell wall hydrolase CwlJ-like protein
MNSDLGKLARVIFAEARGENQASKEAVGDVIRNRVLSSRYPNTYTGVITQRYAFSSLLRGDANRPYYDNPYDFTSNRANRSAWQNSLTAAYKAYHNMSGISQGALLYYSPRSMLPTNSMPSDWDFDQLQEIFINGIEPCKFSFYKYR